MNTILTLTVNPCLDQITAVDRVEPNRKLRMDEPIYEPGGGGINVARAIHRLGGSAFALYVSGGSSGRTLGDLLNEEGVAHRAVSREQATRINHNVFEHDSDRLYRFIMPGPPTTGEVLDRCRQALDDHLEPSAYVVISGSLPPGLPDETYAELAAHLRRHDVRLLLDSSGQSLQHAIRRGVYLIKPNLRELRDLTGEPLDSDPQIAEAGRQLIADNDVEVVLISLGAGGVMLVTEHQTERLAAPTVEIRSRVGAGDSLVAGLALALARGWELPRAARFGVAAGTAAVTTPGTELCRRQDTERHFQNIHPHPTTEFSNE